MRDLLPTLIALLGTLAVALLLGYRQWRKQFVGEQQKSLREQRSAAYQQAWQKLEEVHLYVRSQAYQRDAFNELARAVNVHLMQAGLLLDEGEKGRINGYLDALRTLGEALNAMTDGDARETVREDLYTTAPFPLPKSHDVVAKAMQEVDRCRDDLKSRFRVVLGADKLA
jgi:hypothetical protein